MRFSDFNNLANTIHVSCYFNSIPSVWALSRFYDPYVFAFWIFKFVFAIVANETIELWVVETMLDVKCYWEILKHILPSDLIVLFHIIVQRLLVSQVEVEFHVITDFLLDWDVEYSCRSSYFLVISEIIPHLWIDFLDFFKFFFVENRRKRRASIGSCFSRFLRFNVLFDDFKICFVHESCYLGERIKGS